MKDRPSTRETLLAEGRRLFWSRGYSNVTVREIARAAGVDVALIARHFGSKRGLFEATLAGAFEDQLAADGDTAALVDEITRIFAEAPRSGDQPSLVRMMLMNAHDEEVGTLVRKTERETVQTTLERVIGDPVRAALFLAVLLGFSVAEKSLLLPAIAQPGSPEYAAQLRYLMQSALAYETGN